MIVDSHTLTQDDRLEHLLQQLRQRGCRLTPQRVAILRTVLNSPDHPTAEQIFNQVWDQFPMTSMATVYNTLALLKDMGALLEIDLGHGGARYDGFNPQPHSHLICTRCHTILDTALPELASLQASVAQSTGFQITSHRLDFFGICPNCQPKI